MCRLFFWLMLLLNVLWCYCLLPNLYFEPLSRFPLWIKLYTLRYFCSVFFLFVVCFSAVISSGLMLLVSLRAAVKGRVLCSFSVIVCILFPLLSASAEQWLGCSTTEPKVTGSIPAVADSFCCGRNCRGPCTVRCQFTLKNTRWSILLEPSATWRLS